MNLIVETLTTSTFKEVGHMFLHESASYSPPSGESAAPFGLAPHGSGSAPLRETFGSACSASQKTKPSSALSSEVSDLTLLRSAGFAGAQPHKSIILEKIARVRSHKDVFLRAIPTGSWSLVSRTVSLPPSGPAPCALTLVRALKQRAPHTKASYVKTARVRSHKSIFREHCSLALAQRRGLRSRRRLSLEVYAEVTSAIN